MKKVIATSIIFLIRGFHVVQMNLNDISLGKSFIRVNRSTSISYLCSDIGILLAYN